MDLIGFKCDFGEGSLFGEAERGIGVMNINEYIFLYNKYIERLKIVNLVLVRVSL
jgi:hypothetical protein